ncbi:OqxB [Afipia carboxidovorans OM5]|uniref:Efflux pump membrane transporter n=1 Tax=Afipia carboxidovorans (strain ATCC 49405 / DSM 1227 / KCTC 32145 / OM5) TaxID=504832 RepID=B6JG43_AFIC5|nr:multidrug efflux RND transporter permease subunit [Afipia carboxidovorans]ACI93432.1 OqxB [Afipia carboxidovorans OM5]AEI02856.1 acriflavin resistance protein AcrB [Afipia carboxidovorans OM4]AEI06432.1 acriflavin resistance protein AcrB [Afipia carboxidovorans OM5]
MNLGRLSIHQPILAMVLSIVLLIVGAIAYTTLPVAEYPQVAPPTVVITTQYPGASAQTVSETVAAPIEQEVNGVENMLYMYSQATSNGQLTITVTFKLGTDLDQAQVLVQNRVAIAQPRLPEEVKRNGVVTRKNSPDLLMVVFLLSPDDTFDQLYISNYALLQVRDQLLRTDGVGDIQIFGARDYSMRLWLDPDKIANLGMTAGDVLTAIRAQNLQIAGGRIAEPPISDRAFQPNLTFQGRLKDPEQFENIILKSGENGRTVRLRDVARIELAALSYDTNAFLLRKEAVAILVTQRPGSNALATSERISNTMASLKEKFPEGLDYNIGYNPTEFIAQSVHELIKTIYEAMILVVVVVLVFLQGWRPAIIPILAIPVSLIGTFAVMAALGFAINNLTLFGLVLAVGIVVDDAIVVVENVERHLQAGMTRRDAALLTMQEVGGALVSIALVLCAVFVPTAFLGGISGQFFQQFAVTIAVATAISCFCSLTLSPALASLILEAHHEKKPPARWNVIARWWGIFTGYFNRGFDWLSHFYARAADFTIRHSVAMLALYGVLIGSAGWIMFSTPKGFIPAQDRGYVIISVQLPGAASLARTTEVVKEIENIALGVPGIVRVPTLAGFSGATRTQASNAAAMFPVFDDPELRAKKAGQSAAEITNELRKRLSKIEKAFIIVVPPPAVPGIGTGGGFAMRIEDRQGRGASLLAAATSELVAAANKTPGLTAVFSPFTANTPQVFVDIDRQKAEMLGVPVQNVTEAIEIYFGSAYVNDFNLFGRTYRVTAQADLPFRKESTDLARLRTRNLAGEMVLLGSVVDFRDISGPDRVARYNLYPAAELQGDTLPGTSSATAIEEMKKLAADILPSGFSYDWTDLSYQQVTAANAGLYVFPVCVLFVFLVLAAQYGSWTLPLSVILIVPMCLLTATIGVRLMGQDINILTQIGFVVLVGLAAKNAILIVEFARDIEREGKDTLHAVIEACRLRLRPILMTSFAFILGVLPLVISSGSGSEMRQAVGVAVFFGMIGVTLFGLVFTPIFYMLVRKLFPGSVTIPSRDLGANI